MGCWETSCQLWNEIISDCGLKTNSQVFVSLNQISINLSILEKHLREISYTLQSKLR